MKTLREIIAEEIAKNSSVPTGTIISFSTATPPEGYLKCEGQEVSRSEYKALFDVIGTTYGVGDGSSTFKLPDLRGEFLRGTGTNSHTNQGNGAKVGVHQNATQVPYVWVNEKGTKICSIYNSQDKSLRSRLENSDKTLFNSTELINIAANITESNEEHGSVYTTRPTNTSVLYCIKY